MSKTVEPPISRTEQVDALLATTDTVLKAGRSFSDTWKKYVLSSTIPDFMRPMVEMDLRNTTNIVEVAKRRHQNHGATPAHVANIVFESMDIQAPTRSFQEKYKSKIVLFALFRTNEEGWIERLEASNHIGALLLRHAAPLGDYDLNPHNTMLEHYRTMQRLPKPEQGVEYLSHAYADPIGFEDFVALQRTITELRT